MSENENKLFVFNNFPDEINSKYDPKYVVAPSLDVATEWYKRYFGTSYMRVQEFLDLKPKNFFILEETEEGLKTYSIPIGIPSLWHNNYPSPILEPNT